MLKVISDGGIIKLIVAYVKSGSGDVSDLVISTAQAQLKDDARAILDKAIPFWQSEETATEYVIYISKEEYQQLKELAK